MALAEAGRLIARLLKVLDDRMTPSGHPYALVIQEHRGTCPYDRHSARCDDYRALFVHGTRWLDQYGERAHIQLALLEVG
jgi:hypothetical protein